MLLFMENAKYISQNIFNNFALDILNYTRIQNFSNKNFHVEKIARIFFACQKILKKTCIVAIRPYYKTAHS